MEKHCYTCNTTQPVDFFNKNRTTKDGFYHQCRCCQNEYKKKYRKANPDKNKEQKRRERENRNKKLGLPPPKRGNRYNIKLSKNDRFRLWYENNKALQKTFCDKWYKANKKQHVEKNKTISKKHSDGLSDYYIKKILTQNGINKEQITPGLIELERIILKIKRKCKQQTSNS